MPCEGGRKERSYSSIKSVHVPNYVQREVLGAVCVVLPRNPAGIWGTGKEAGVSYEMRAVLLQVCCCTGGLCSAAVQFLLSLQHLRGVGGGNHLQSRSPQSNPTGFHASYSSDPADVLTWHQGLALVSLTGWGRQCPFLQLEDEEEQAAKNWGTVSPWASRQLLTTGIWACNLASHGSLPTSL